MLKIEAAGRASFCISSVWKPWIPYASVMIICFIIYEIFETSDLLSGRFGMLLEPGFCVCQHKIGQSGRRRNATRVPADFASDPGCILWFFGT